MVPPRHRSRSVQFRAIFNKDGGTLRTMDLEAFRAEAEAVFARQGHRLEARIVAGAEVEAALRDAADSDAEVILAAGGDGTISTAAGIAFASGKPLAVLPAGTMNLFARSLGLPNDLRAAVAAIARGEMEKIDIATANDRPFVHQFGVGTHARLVRIRDQMSFRSRLGKMLASLRAVSAAAIDPPRFEVHIERDGVPQRQTVSGVVVSNNRLDNAPVPVAERLDAGRLGIYVAAPMQTRELVGLFADMLLNRWRENALISESQARQITLTFPRRKGGVKAVIDGELIDLAGEVRIRIHPGALSVIRPQPEDRAG